jgi:hypothetical protein
MRRIAQFLALGTILVATMPAASPSASAVSADVGPCAPSSVVITEYNVNVAAGSVEELDWIKNVSDQSCTLRRFVRVTYIGTYSPRPHVMKPHQLVVGETDFYEPGGGVMGGLKRGLAVPTVILSPRTGLASFWIAGTDESYHQLNGRMSRCIMSYKMLVWLPGATRPVTALPERAGNFDWCGPLRITPILTGRSGSDPAQPLSKIFGTPST